MEYFWPYTKLFNFSCYPAHTRQMTIWLLISHRCFWLRTLIEVIGTSHPPSTSVRGEDMPLVLARSFSGWLCRECYKTVSDFYEILKLTVDQASTLELISISNKYMKETVGRNNRTSSVINQQSALLKTLWYIEALSRRNNLIFRV